MGLAQSVTAPGQLQGDGVAERLPVSAAADLTPWNRRPAGGPATPAGVTRSMSWSSRQLRTSAGRGYHRVLASPCRVVAMVSSSASRLPGAGPGRDGTAMDLAVIKSSMST